MEKHYQKERQLENHYQSQPEAAKYELNLKDKESLFKEIYSSIDLFEKLLYDAKQDNDQ